MRSGWGPRLRAWPETLAWPLGAGLARAAWHRRGARVAEPLAGVKTPALARPPPLLLVEGLGGKRASRTGECRLEAQGRRRAGKRQQPRGGRSALGGWPEGHGDSGPGQGAEGARAAPWQACLGELALQGGPAAPPDWVGRDGAHGLERARAPPRYGVAHQRGMGQTSQQLAAHGVCGALPVAPRGDAAPAPRQAKRPRQNAGGGAARGGDDGASETPRRERAAVVRQAWADRAPAAVATFVGDCDQT
jgi:hypothetical protein